MYSVCRDGSDGSSCQVYTSSVDTSTSGYMTVDWDDCAGANECDCDNDCEVKTSWKATTSGSTLTIETINDEVDYDAGHTVYTGYSLDGTTYEVTRNGYASQTHTFTC